MLILNWFLKFVSFYIEVSGLGFGIISGAFSLVNVLGDMTGPGTVGIYGDSQAFFLVSCKTYLLTCFT